MIRTIRDNFETYMIRPIIYHSVTRVVVAIVLALLWNRFINQIGTEAIFERAFLTVGVFFIGVAWFTYLKMDGMSVHHLLEEKEKKKKKRHSHADIVDYADEKIVAFDELEPEEKLICRFIGNIICGLLFILLSILIPALI